MNEQRTPDRYQQIEIDRAELARTLLLKIAAEHPRVLKDPPPHALFDGFGDSTLNCILRVYICNIDFFLLTRHEINTAIDDFFLQLKIRDPKSQQTANSLSPLEDRN